MNSINDASIKRWFRKNLKKSNICYDKHHTRLLSFIIAFCCSTVMIGKNTKNSKKYASLGTAIEKSMGKSLGDHIHLVF